MTAGRLAFVLCACAALTTDAAIDPIIPVRVTVDAEQVVRSMRGGMGASFHAIEHAMPGHRPDGSMLAGSAWGGNPPASDEKAWNEIFRYADWLGLDWCRVEIEQRMYEPRRREFDWDSAEMRILYRILDWAEKKHVDVFLQQMWSNTDWNAYPELRGTPLGRVTSAPLSMDDFAYGLGEVVDHLTRVRGYRSIKWVAINNEPGWNWSWWQGPDGRPLPITPGFAAAQREFARRGLTVPLSGPDWTDLPALEPAKIDFDAYVGAYDLHSYNAIFDGMNCGYPLSRAEDTLRQWAGWAHARNKPLFLSELGTMAFGFRGREPGPGIYESGVKDAALVVRGLRAGVDGFNRWSMVNRGDLDGQWQLIDTWDPDAEALLSSFTPHPNTFYLFGLLSRFTAAHSDVLRSTVEGTFAPGHRQVVAAALRSPRGELSVLVVNEMYWQADVGFSVENLPAGRKLYRYIVTPAARDRRVFSVAATGTFSGPRFHDRVPGLSVAVYSTYELPPDAPGVQAESR